MKTTISLGWKALVSKIHPPLPMSPGESQRLLTLLNSSFRQQLDRHRPSDIEDYTSLHLNSILTNPLFGRGPSSKGEAKVTLIVRKKQEKSMDLIQEFMKRPMDIFNEHIAAGTATMQTAMLCLQAEFRNALASPATTASDALRCSHTASTMLDWLWASCAESLDSLLQQPHLFRLLVPFLVADKRQTRIWNWLRILQSSLDPVPSLQSRLSITKLYDQLLLGFLKAEISVGDGSAAAVAIYIRAVKEWQPKIPGPFKGSTWYLTSVLMELPKPAHLQQITIRPFMEITGTMRKPKTLLSACHWVHLAESPDLKVALSYLESVQPRTIVPKTRPKVVLLALKAAELLLEKGRESDALWIIKHLQENFGNEIGEINPSQPEKQLQGGLHEAEESSLRLLGALAIH